MQIFPLSEGSFTIDKTKVFIPFNKEKDDLQQRNTGSLLVEIQPFVIKTSTDVILLDTGLGFADGKELQIHNNLRQHNIEPTEVSIVLLSHLHKDHAGGIRSSITNALSFPNARYYVHSSELAFAAKTSSSYQPEDFLMLSGSPQLHTFEGDKGQVNEQISFEVSGGHCPYHTVFWIKDDGEIIFFGGDVAPQLQQMKSRFIAKYDQDGKKSMELRTEWWERSASEHWTMLFYHDIKTPMVKR